MENDSIEKLLLQQIDEEYQIAKQFMEPKRAEWLKRLKLYNNQSRQKDKVGDPLLFTVFQTVFSSLYDDKLGVTFEGYEDGDSETAENLTELAKHDYRIMHKSEIDYDWDWDTCFFGRGLLLLNEFDRQEGVMCPIAEVIDPVMWLRDPRATSVNGDYRGRGAMRFGGREINLTKKEMEDLKFENIDKLEKEKEVRNTTDEVRQERRSAQGTDSMRTQEEALTENYEYNLLEWYTIVDGKKKIIITGNGRKIILKEYDIKGKTFPIVDRSLFPISHDWDGVSIPDLIEDKQRARAKMVNLGLDAAIADLHPMYFYNKKKIRNKRDLDFAFNKAVGVDGDTRDTFLPMQKANTVSQQVQNIFNILDVAAQKSVAAPEIAQGVAPRQERTLGEQELVAAARGARMSLAAAIWGWSERRFWERWYWLYKKHFKNEIDEKVIRIRGPLANRWRTLTRDNVITKIDPDVFVESERVSEAERQRKFAEYSQFMQLAMQDPTSNRRYLLRRMGSILKMKHEEIFLAIPPTPSEMLAEDENVALNENKFVRGNHFDEHIAHIEIHRKANQNPASMAHIYFHKEMIKNQQEFPESFPQQQQQEEGREFDKFTPPVPIAEEGPTRAELMGGR